MNTPSGLSAVPLGYVSLTDAMKPICAAIRKAADRNVDRLIELVGETARRAPPRAIMDAAISPMFGMVCREELKVFTLHPTSDTIVEVPSFVFTSSREPFNLLRGPRAHSHAVFPSGYEAYSGLTFFVERAAATACALRAIDKILGRNGIDSADVESPAGQIGRVRDDLFGAVADGRLSVDEAEARAELLGVAPLRPFPQPMDYDPCSDPRWTLPMALAWIAWRDVDAVRHFYPKFRAERRIWRESHVARADGSRLSGYVLEGVRHVEGSLRELHSYAAVHADKGLARFNLAQLERDFVSKAADASTGLMVLCAGETIPPEQWLQLQICQSRDGGTALHSAGDVWGTTDYKYSGALTINGNKVRDLWPPNAGQGAAPTNQLIGKNASDWWVNHGGREAAFAVAKQKFGKPTGREVDETGAEMWNLNRPPEGQVKADTLRTAYARSRRK